MTQPQRTGLRAQDAARAHPSQRPRTGNFRQQLIVQGAQRRDSGARRHTGVVRDGDVDTAAGQLTRDPGDVAGGHVDNHAHIRLVGLDM